MNTQYSNAHKKLTLEDIARLKKTAKKYKKTHGIKHAEALDETAQAHGFETWAGVAAQEILLRQPALKIPKPSITFEEEPSLDEDIGQIQRRSADYSPSSKLTMNKNRRLLASKGIEYAVFEPTKNGLKKSILDATQQVRKYFEEAGFHNYRQQNRGTNNKVVKEAYFLTSEGIKFSKGSFYRPETKNGDPRMWFTGLPSFAGAGDQVAIIIKKDSPHLLLISESDLEKYLGKDNPIGNFINEYIAEDNEVADELLGKLKALALHPIPADGKGDTDIGMAVEAALGIPANSSKKPDYKGIELKSGRSPRVRTSMFGQVADWNLSRLKSSGEILDNYGYDRPEDFRLYCTVKINKPNPQGLMLRCDENGDYLEEIQSDGESVAHWPGSLLRARLLEKHQETFWIKAESVNIDGREHFWLKSVIHTKSPLANQFMPLLASGVITMDHLIKRKNGASSAKEKGPLFKIDKKNLKLLFPDPVEYSLT